MSLWGEIFAAGYDLFMARAEQAGLAQWRRQLLGGAAGRVLEIGGGTGANLPFYGSGVRELFISEPDEPMARRLERKLHGYHIATRIIHSTAEELPLSAGSVDCVVSTLVLCTVTNPARVLAEIRRVLKRYGEFYFIEHVRSEEPRLARWQDRLRRPWAWFGNGCQCNRPTLQTICEARFSPVKVKHEQLLKAPPIVRPVVVGTAVCDS